MIDTYEKLDIDGIEYKIISIIHHESKDPIIRLLGNGYIIHKLESEISMKIAPKSSSSQS